MIRCHTWLRKLLRCAFLRIEGSSCFHRNDPLAQLAEHLTFNQGVRSSSLRWVTRKVLVKQGLFLFQKLRSQNMYEMFAPKMLIFPLQVRQIVSSKESTAWHLRMSAIPPWHKVLRDGIARFAKPGAFKLVAGGASPFELRSW